jgi:hypothetical protein
VDKKEEVIVTQKERLLDLFFKRNVWTNHELREMRPAMYQFPARIKELNEGELLRQGLEIVGYFDENDRNKYFYELRPRKAKDDLFLADCA